MSDRHLFSSLVATCVLFFALAASHADAAKVRPFQETFGSAAQPTFTYASGLAVDQSTGDLLVLDRGNLLGPIPIFPTIRRYHEDGTPANFAALGTNTIDGTGVGDQTPQNKFEFLGSNGTTEVQVAVAPPGAAAGTAGDIYVTQPDEHLIDIFAADGHYLGQLTSAGGSAFGETCGVAVDSTGSVYVSDFTNNIIHKFDPSANPPADTDNSANFLFAPGRPCTLAAGAGPTSGYIFVTKWLNSSGELPAVHKFDSSTGDDKYTFSPRSSSGDTRTLTVDDSTGNVLTAIATGGNSTINEYDASGAANASLVSSTHISRINEGIALSPSGGRLYVASYPFATLQVFGAPVSLPTVTAQAATGVSASKATLNGVVNPQGIAVTDCLFEYGTSNAYGTVIPCEGAIPADSGDHAVSAALTSGLADGTTYHFRIVASNANGTEASDDQTFTTHAAAVTLAAADVTGTKATLNGIITPPGTAVTECFFEYGTTTSYGNAMPCQGAIPADEAGHPVVAALTQLAANGTVYHFRVVAVGGFGTAHGADVSFSTRDTVVTTTASNLAKTTATLNGTVDPEGIAFEECVFEYGVTTAYGQTAQCAESPAEIGAGVGSKAVHADLGLLAAETSYHFRLVAKSVYGTVKGADKMFATAGKPEIVDSWAADVVFTEATVEAVINPHNDAATYRIEWGGIDEPYEHSSAEYPLGADASDHVVSRVLGELAPDTSYYWRVVASNSVGISVGPDHTFTTYRQSGTEPDCTNQAFRISASRTLPDCRAYEMVSPVEKSGGDIVHHGGGPIQASTDGNKITYETRPSFGDQPANLLNQYLAAREAGQGWTNHGIHPPLGSRKPVNGTTLSFSPEFEAFSSDLCNAWFEDVFNPPLTPDGQEGYANIYRLDLCGDSGYEALTTAEPPAGTSTHYVATQIGLSVGGFSDDSRHVIFAAAAALTPDAAPQKVAQLYDRFDGELHLVSVLPKGGAEKGSPDPAGAGVGSDPSYNLDNAVSIDGSRVYWSSGLNQASGLGRLFLREHPEQGIVAGECDEEAANPCTLRVSVGPFAFFWAAAADGSGALYEENENLVEYDLQKFEKSEPPREAIASHVKGVLGASDDLSRVYFVSTDALTGSQQNNEGDEAEAGKPNLYLAEGGKYTFIATLLAADVGEGTQRESRAYDVVSKQPHTRAARVSPDGAHIAFESRAPLTGFENVDPSNGEANVEVFTYAAGGELHCVSCNPSGARPSGPELHEPYRNSGSPTTVFASAWIPPWENPLYASHVLSDDGSRLFFHSYDALLPADTNNAMDVYEWEAPDAGTCTQDSPSYHSSNGGCIFLISTGESPFESEFWDASSDGRDVFFTTESSLLPQDPGLVDLYDARAGGGFPQPSQAAACEGEACQSPPAAPDDPTPASSAFEGKGNVVEATTGTCAKGKVRKSGKCVKRHKKPRQSKHGRVRHRTANNDRGAAR